MDLPAGILTLQRTDRWVGAPLCAILTLLRRIFECVGRPGPHQVRRILFVKFAEQGSTVLAYPAILRAIEMVGRENVYFVVFEDNRFILDAMEIIPEGNVITIATKSLFGLATGALRAVLRVRKIGIDAGVDMEFLTRFSAILTFATGAKSRVGFHTFFGDGPYRGDLMTHRLLYNPHLHTSEMFEAMVEALTRDPSVLPTFDFRPSENQPLAGFRPSLSEVAEINALLQRENPRIGSAPLILLNPNASDLLPLRRWRLCAMPNLPDGCSNVTRTCLSDLPVRQPKPPPITSLQTRSARIASSGLPEKQLCGTYSRFTRAVR